MLLFNTKLGKHYGKLYFYSVPYLYIDYPISYYDSLAAMIQTTIDAYKLKIYSYDDKEIWLYVDNQKFNELAKKNNGNSTYWTEHDTFREEEWYEI